MAITVTFACGHRLSGSDQMTDPVCPTCGERRVTRVAAPPPRFTGVVHGPCATFQDLPAQPVRLAKET